MIKSLIIIILLSCFVSSQINLSNVLIDSSSICSGENINFLVSSSDGHLVIPDNLYVYLNGNLYNGTIGFNINQKEYFVPSDNLSIGSVDVFSIAIQQGKMVNASKTIMVNDCSSTKNDFKDKVVELSKSIESFYQDNTSLSLLIIGVVIFLIIITIILKADIR